MCYSDCVLTILVEEEKYLCSIQKFCVLNFKYDLNWMVVNKLLTAADIQYISSQNCELHARHMYIPGTHNTKWNLKPVCLTFDCFFIWWWTQFYLVNASWLVLWKLFMRCWNLFRHYALTISAWQLCCWKFCCAYHICYCIIFTSIHII